jgi:NADH:ubiquinone oxidoreductase subunit C
MENEITVDKAQLILEVQNLAAQKARFATATCLDMSDHFEVIYHFEPQDNVKFARHIRVNIGKDETLPSISSIYLCASLIENEIKEHFRIKISNIAIDFKGRFLRAKESPEFALMKDYKVKKE